MQKKKKGLTDDVCESRGGGAKCQEIEGVSLIMKSIAIIRAVLLRRSDTGH